MLDPILEETGLSRTLLSTLYAGGTAVSAAMVMISAAALAPLPIAA